MKNKQIRRIIVFIMCMVFLFNLAVSAYASSAGGAWSSVSIPADVGVSSVMNGLGVLPGESPDAYNGILGRCVDYLTELGYVIAGKIDAWKREQVEGTPWGYGLEVSIIDVIRAWLFDEDVVTSSYDSSVSTNTWNGNNITWTLTSGVGFTPITIRYLFDSGNYSYAMYLVSDSYFQFQRDSNGSITGGLNPNHTSGLYWSEIYTTNNLDRVYPGFPIVHTVVLPDGVTSISQNRFDGYTYSSTVTTSYDLGLGVIYTPEISLADAYPIWHGNSVVVPPIVGGGSESDDDVIVYPIAPGNTLEDTQDKTQEDVWVGDDSITDSPAIPDTATLADVLSAIISIPQDIVASIIQALSNFFGFSGTADAYAISLTDFFPFCIPFDIYEFLSVLSAAPEAPVFHWEIPVPQLGRTFDIDVDLSPWDPVAAVFRTFELLAFIVGLGMVTREKFLRS